MNICVCVYYMRKRGRWTGRKDGKRNQFLKKHSCTQIYSAILHTANLIQSETKATTRNSVALWTQRNHSNEFSSLYFFFLLLSFFLASVRFEIKGANEMNTIYVGIQEKWKTTKHNDQIWRIFMREKKNKQLCNSFLIGLRGCQSLLNKRKREKL